MNSQRSTVVFLHHRAPDAALEGLNRLTGLRFTQWPESLVNQSGLQSNENMHVVPADSEREWITG